jgi:hypothetical protein
VIAHELAHVLIYEHRATTEEQIILALEGWLAESVR